MKKEKERLLFRVMLVFWLIKATIGKVVIAKPGCQDACGNVAIPYPFGIGSDCSANHTFTITCNTSKPFLNSINLEVLEIRLSDSTIRVNSPVNTSDCPKGGISSTGPRPYLNLSATPFSFNNTHNLFIGIGCGSVAQLFDDTTNQGTAIVECLSRCSNVTSSTGILESGCYGINCCLTQFPPISYKVVTVSFSSIDIDSRSNNTSRCNYGFLVEANYWLSNFMWDPFDVEASQNVPLVLDWTTDENCYYPKLCIYGQDCNNYQGRNFYGSDRMYCSCRDGEGNAYLPNGCPSVIGKAAIAKSGCQDVCGNVTIPYPFGIGSNCSANHTFTITCNTSKPFLNSINLEVLEIRLRPSTIRVNSPVTTSDCPMGGISNGPRPYLDLSATPFLFNNTYNIFTGIGCGSVAQLFDATTNQGTEILECVSRCSNATTTSRGRLESGCNGIDCCQKTLPPISSKVVNVSLSSIDAATKTTSSFKSKNTSGCNYAFLVEEKWFSNLTDPFALEGRENVPLVLDWTTDENCFFPYKVCGNGFDGPCEDGYYPFNIYGSDREYCACPRHFEGNAYLPNGCQDFDDYECDNSEMCDDNKICNKYHYCVVPPKSKTLMFAIVGIGSGLGGLFLITGAWWLWKIIKRRKKAKLKKKFFKRNGGLLLQQQLTSAEQGYVEKTKVFTSKELEKATDGYSEDRILGHGGQGTVYKGMLTDGKIVAIKKSKIVDEEKLEEFINEVVILSQINHRNVVKLHGCCLETEVPMLVYDFIPNGTLFQYIHHKQNEDFPLSWDVRLRIASEVAEALSYLHSAASQPIYHRDVKSTNILLDDKYRAKVADFGTSRSTDIDQTHMTTRVQGTFGYLDPEYFQSSQFTAKSDVYSFGVVLLELLTGQKAVLPITFEEGRSLATYFMFSMEENRLFDILDSQVLEEGGKEEINGVANLARRCLNLNGKKRPTMKEVAMELEVIRISPRASPPGQEHYEEVNDLSIIELARPWDIASTSITSSVEDKPLLFN